MNDDDNKQHSTPAKQRFHVVGPRTFQRVEDRDGKLVAYVGGENVPQMQARAAAICKVLNEMEEQP